MFKRAEHVTTKIFLGLGLAAVTVSSWQLGRPHYARDVAATKMPQGIFHDPKASFGTEVFLGGVDAVAAMLFFKHAKNGWLNDTRLERDYKDALVKHEKAIIAKNSNRALDDLIKVREAKVAGLGLEHARAVGAKGKAAAVSVAEIKQAQDALDYAKEIRTMDPAARRALIASAEQAFKEVTAEGAKAMRDKALRSQQRWAKFKLAGGVFFTFDAIGRVVVWNKLDADPTLSPAGTIVRYYAYDRWLNNEEKNEPVTIGETVADHKKKKGDSAQTYLDSLAKEGGLGEETLPAPHGNGAKAPRDDEAPPSAPEEALAAPSVP